MTSSTSIASFSCALMIAAAPAAAQSPPGSCAIVDADAAFGRVVAVTADGGVWRWGWREAGTPEDIVTEPRPVAGIDAVIAVSAGRYHTLALRADGTVWGWGQNYFGSLGLSGTVRSKARSG